jgi:hypothetical protein
MCREVETLALQFLLPDLHYSLRVGKPPVQRAFSLGIIAGLAQKGSRSFAALRQFYSSVSLRGFLTVEARQSRKRLLEKERHLSCG